MEEGEVINDTPHPLYFWESPRLSVPQGRSGRVRKNSPQSGFDPWPVQPVASRYTDCAIAAHVTEVDIS
jgi:hypothetical protein